MPYYRKPYLRCNNHSHWVVYTTNCRDHQYTLLWVCRLFRVHWEYKNACYAINANSIVGLCRKKTSIHRKVHIMSGSPLSLNLLRIILQGIYIYSHHPFCGFNLNCNFHHYFCHKFQSTSRNEPACPIYWWTSPRGRSSTNPCPMPMKHHNQLH